MRIRKTIVLILWLMTWLLVWMNPDWKALWPSILALFSVFLLNRVIAGLLIGASAGMILIKTGNPLEAFVSYFSEHLIPALQSSWNLSILIFTLLLGGFVALLDGGGGIQSILLRLLAKPGKLKKKLQWSAYTLGLICFFDGLANSMLVGKSLAAPAKRAGISGEKMAYIVDSTSSAVACVAIISTWIAYQLSMIREGYLQVDPTTDIQPFTIFLRSVPFNFYSWFTLILLAIVIARNWNIGSMRHAEANATPDPIDSSDAQENNSFSTFRAWGPLVFLVGGLLVGLYWNGTSGKILPFNFQRISEAYGQADAALVMLCTSALACIIAYLLNASSIRKLGSCPMQVFGNGVSQLLNPVLILISAWVLSSTLKELNTVSVLTQFLQGNFPVWLFPVVVFIIGALISFTTGTSWGTMGVLMPLALPVALQLGPEASDTLISSTIAAVFSGAVFGDHCSPLSDTTIVSSISCGVEPLKHVKTQLPYALITATVATFIGFIPVGLGASPWLSLAVGTGVLLSLPFISRYFEKRNLVE